VTVLAREARVSTPVVASSVPWLHLVHALGTAGTRISHDELLHGGTDLREVDATIMVAIQSVEEPLSLIRSHIVVELVKETHDLVECDCTIASNLEPFTLELGLTLGSPDGLVVHVGSHLTREDGITSRETASHHTHARLTGVHSGHTGLTGIHSGHTGLTGIGLTRIAHRLTGVGLTRIAHRLTGIGLTGIRLNGIHYC